MRLEFFSTQDIEKNPLTLEFFIDLQKFAKGSILKGVFQNPEKNYIELGIRVEEA